MKVLEFRKLTTDDVYDERYSHDGPTWSRVYEYPLVLNLVGAYVPQGGLIHNASWGFAGVHVTFKNRFDELFNVEHSDILASGYPRTFVYDITKPPSDDMVQKYDAVVCISTLEEVRADHVGAFNNLYRQLKPGGHLIITFDLPGLQLDKFEKMFGLKLQCSGTPINGANSRLKNDKYANLNVGLMVVQKDD